MNGPPIVVDKQMRKNEFRKEPRSRKYSPRGHEKGGSDPGVCGLLAATKPARNEAGFVPIVTSGVAPALEEVLLAMRIP